MPDPNTTQNEFDAMIASLLRKVKAGRVEPLRRFGRAKPEQDKSFGGIWNWYGLEDQLFEMNQEPVYNPKRPSRPQFDFKWSSAVEPKPVPSVRVARLQDPRAFRGMWSKEPPSSGLQKKLPEIRTPRPSPANAMQPPLPQPQPFVGPLTEQQMETIRLSQIQRCSMGAGPPQIPGGAPPHTPIYGPPIPQEWFGN